MTKLELLTALCSGLGGGLWISNGEIVPGILFILAGGILIWASRLKAKSK